MEPSPPESALSHCKANGRGSRGPVSFVGRVARVTRTHDGAGGAMRGGGDVGPLIRHRFAMTPSPSERRRGSSDVRCRSVEQDAGRGSKSKRIDMQSTSVARGRGRTSDSARTPRHREREERGHGALTLPSPNAVALGEEAVSPLRGLRDDDGSHTPGSRPGLLACAAPRLNTLDAAEAEYAAGAGGAATCVAGRWNTTPVED